jgi:uncharacterized protein involved in propanediol utilization
MKRLLILIFIVIPLLSYSQKDSADVEILKREALTALKNYNKTTKDEQESSTGVIVAYTGILGSVLGLLLSYQANKLSRKANKIAKRN